MKGQVKFEDGWPWPTFQGHRAIFYFCWFCFKFCWFCFISGIILLHLFVFGQLVNIFIKISGHFSIVLVQTTMLAGSYSDLNITMITLGSLATTDGHFLLWQLHSSCQNEHEQCWTVDFTWNFTLNIADSALFSSKTSNLLFNPNLTRFSILRSFYCFAEFSDLCITLVMV